MDGALPADILRAFCVYLDWDQFFRLLLTNSYIQAVIRTTPRKLKHDPADSLGLSAYRSITKYHLNFVEVKGSSPLVPAFVKISPACATSLGQTLVKVNVHLNQSFEIQLFISSIPILKALQKLKLGLVTAASDLRVLLFKTPNLKQLFLKITNIDSNAFSMGETISQNCPKLEVLRIADDRPFLPVTSADLEACKALFKPLWTMQHLQFIDFGRFQKLASWRNMNEESFWAGLADLVQQLWPPGETASPRCVLAMTDLLRKISEETPRHLAQQVLGHPLVFAVMTPKQRAEIAFHFCTQVPSFLDLLLARNIDLCFLTARHGILYRGHIPLLYTIAHWIQSESSFRALLLDRNCTLPDGKRVSAIQYSLKLHPGFQFSCYMSLYTAIATSQHPRVIPLLELLNQHREAIIQDSQDPHIVGNPSDTDISGLSIFDRPRAIPMDFALTHYFLKEGVPGNAKLLVEHIMQPRITRLILERSPRVLLAKANHSQQSAFIVILKALCLQLKMAIINSVGVILDCMDRDEALKQECLTDEAISLIATSFKMLVGNARDDLRKQSGILRRLYSVLDHQRLLFVAKGSILASQAAFMGWELSKFEDALPDENSIFYLISDACCELELANLNLQKPSLLVPPGKLTAPPARNASRQTDHDDSYSYNAHYNKGFAGISKNSVHVLILRIFQIMSKSARFPEVIAAWNKHGVPVLHACITFSGAGLGQEVSESYFQIRSASAKLLVAAGIDTDMKDYTGHRALEYGSYEEKASWIRILRPETEAVGASGSSSAK